MARPSLPDPAAVLGPVKPGLETTQVVAGAAVRQPWANLGRRTATSTGTHAGSKKSLRISWLERIGPRIGRQGCGLARVV